MNILSMSSFGSNISEEQAGFLSTNNGTQWNPVNAGLPSSNVCLCWGSSNVCAGLTADFISTNNGTSWFRHQTG
jgi:hypothetical protein